MEPQDLAHNAMRVIDTKQETSADDKPSNFSKVKPLTAQYNSSTRWKSFNIGRVSYTRLDDGAGRGT